MNGPMVIQPRDGVTLGRRTHRLMEARVVQGRGHVPGVEFDTGEIVRPVGSASQAVHAQHPERFALHQQRDGEVAAQGQGVGRHLIVVFGAQVDVQERTPGAQRDLEAGAPVDFEAVTEDGWRVPVDGRDAGGVAVMEHERRPVAGDDARQAVKDISGQVTTDRRVMRG